MNPRSLYATSLAAGLLLLGGCDRPCTETVDSEQGQLGFDDPFFLSLPTTYVSGDPVVEGSQFCAELSQWYEGPQRDCVAISAERDEYFDPCWARSVQGPAEEIDAGCLRLRAPGEVTWSFEPRACDIDVPTPGFGPDALRFDVRPFEAMEARMLWFFEERAENQASPGPRPGFPDDWLDPVGSPVRLVGEGLFEPVLGLHEPGVSDAVAYTGGIVRGEALEGAPVFTEGLFGVGVQLEPGERVRLDLELPVGTVPGPELLGVPASDVATVTMIAAYEPPEAGEAWGPPLGVRAVLRDRHARLLRAASVDWEVQGEGARVFEARGDVALLEVPCTPPEAGSGDQFAKVVARVAGIESAIDLRWTSRACEEPAEDPFTPDPAPLDFGLCACRSGADGPGVLGVGLWVLVLVRLRRR